jgi:putative membrane protein insertion efficiency factor
MNAPEAGVDLAASTHRSGAARWLLLFTVRLYRAFFSPFFGAACKFHPSCSQYALQAIERWGARRGSWLALKRLGRCRPFSRGGYDPVPELPDENSVAAVQAVRAGEVTR